MRFSASVLLALLLSMAQAQTPSPVLVLPNSGATQVRSGSVLALADGRLAVVNPLSDSLALLDGRGRIVAEVALGTGSGPTVLSLSVDGRTAVVLESLGEAVAWVDLRQQVVLQRAPWPEQVVPRRVLALSDDQALIDGYQVQAGRWQVAAAFCGAPLTLWGGLCLGFAPSGEEQALRLSRLDQPAFRQDVGGVGLGLALALDARRGRAYVLYSRATLSQEHWIEEIELATLRRLRTFWLPAADRLRAMPSAMLYDGRLGRLYLAYPLEQRVVAIDLRSGLRVGEARTGTYPDGLALSGNSMLLYARNAADQTVTVIDADFMIARDTWPSSGLTVDGRLRLGARLYHSAEPPLSRGARACASCHASADRPTWTTSPQDQSAAWWDEHVAQQQGGLSLSELERAALVAYVQRIWHKR
ncbi:MAG: hypothetical protein NZ750_05020 [Anaerolineae bacterium]|nr:hypothetical protein [Anaerolineae bacterium]MDW8172139.1 hypothetical protein [Anaerolineae bacterium]